MESTSHSKEELQEWTTNIQDLIGEIKEAVVVSGPWKSVSDREVIPGSFYLDYPYPKLST